MSTVSSKKEKSRANVGQQKRYVTIISLALLIASCVLLVSNWGTTPFLRYIRSSPKTIIAEANESKHLSYEEQYHLAEAQFEAGNFDEAASLVYNLLSMRRIPQHLTGHAHFVLAKIEAEKGNFEKALLQANLAKTIYLNSPDDRSRSLRGIQAFACTIFIQNGEYHKALSKLELLFKSEHSSSYRAYFAYQISEAHFWLGQLDAALSWGNLALTNYSNAGDSPGIANALLNIAWLEIVTGNLNSGRKNLESANKIAEDTGKGILRSYIELTEALYHKCSGEPKSFHHFLSSRDPKIRKYVTFAIGHECIDFADRDPIVVNDPPPAGGSEPRPEKKEKKLMAQKSE